MNVGQSLLTLYLIIAGNFLAPLFACRIQNLFANNMAVKHIIGFLTLTLFVSWANKKQNDFASIFGSSLLLYVWFMLSTKMNVNFWLAFLLLIVVLFGIYLYEESSDEEKLDDKTKEQIELVKKILTGILAAITLIGSLLYYGEKRIEYKANFNHYLFFFGKPNCKGKTPEISMSDSLKAAVHLS